MGAEKKLKSELKKRLGKEFESESPSAGATSMKNDCFIVSSSSSDGRDTYKSIIKQAIPSQIHHVYLWNEKAWVRGGGALPRGDLIESVVRSSRYFIADLSPDIVNGKKIYEPTAYYWRVWHMVFRKYSVSFCIKRI